MSSEPTIKFSNEESKAIIRFKISQNLINLIELTKSTVKSSESSDLFKNCFKNFVANEDFILNSSDKLKRIEIISNQLNYQLESIKSDCEQIKEVKNQIENIQKPL